MGIVDIEFCDMCGKKTRRLNVKLTLVENYKNKKYTYWQSRTLRSWKICKRCSNKMNGLQTVGDKIQERLEEEVDNIRTEITEEPVIITKMKKEKKIKSKKPTDSKEEE